MEFVNKITGYVLALVLGAILVGGLLIPTVEGIQTNIGDEIKITNNSPIVLREAEPGDVLECLRTVSGGVATDAWTLNGEAVVGPTGSADTWNVGILSDGLYVQVYAPNIGNPGAWYNMSDAPPTINYLLGGGDNGAHYGMVFGDDTITIYSGYGGESPTTVVTATYTWAYVICPYGDGEYCAPLSGGVGIVKNPEQVILCGAYTTGDFDTMYAYINGETYVSNSAYTMTANISTVTHSGTTDIYDATVSVTISDGGDNETFTPYRILVPYEVSGHESSGTYYVMFGVISILGIVALVVVAANAIRNKY